MSATDEQLETVRSYVETLQAENAKLRELVRDMWNGMCGYAHDCRSCEHYELYEGQRLVGECQYHARMHELGGGGMSYTRGKRHMRFTDGAGFTRHCWECANATDWNGEEIVRCRDCKHCREHNMRAYGGNCNQLLCHHFSMSDDAGWPVEPDGFCAWGERRDA